MILENHILEEGMRDILDSIQPGGTKWATFMNGPLGDCLKSCPAYKSCRGNGPNHVCSKNWRKAPISAPVLDVLFHIFNNFDYYNRGDLKEYDDKSSEVQSIRDVIFDLATTLSTVSAEIQENTDPITVDFEDLRLLRIHKQYDRNPKLAAQAKEHHGWKYQACGFDFRENYGELGEKYIEAHHLVSFSSLKGKRVALDPIKDFCVLCANCHRMINRSEHVNNIDAFRKKHLKSSEIDQYVKR